MSTSTERDLIRLLHQELSAAEAEALRRRMLESPELAAAYRRLRRVWAGLELVAPAPPSPGLARSIRQRAEGLTAGSGDRLPLPRWVPVAALLALLVGTGLGARLGLEIEAGSTPAVEVSFSGATLAESYWQAVAAAGATAESAEVAP